MMKCTACTLIIKDDFENVLILKKKVKKGQIGKWSLLSQNLRGKESDEKCLNKASNKILKTIIFDLEPYKEFVLDSDSDEGIRVYKGEIKGRFVLDKSYDDAQWVNKNKLSEYEFEDIDKLIMENFIAE
ncbi:MULTISPECIES: hypothetical protein [Clostridium]|uniref:Nudix hydrolase domain-containing protein n=5 Tax=Clostridium TaxID=1485 RepID=C4IIC1_CLOBU|nr:MULTISPECIES: hypothetical protein [Clostridium]APF23424.1 hypothetical protein NPD4_1893 [Clostridium butyricum]AXB84721.1 hypothetical protein DRB99_07000 [Clostridium butyricum]EDT76266.1 conserved hypothetical protein [Clostridium butyricum 5521]EEP54471.1 conserved hypothetical protein [Clostridium butyricum E4 str. BoNT E BL5262]ENZ36379.1 hypothetical protein HMPREF1084_00963 [Clostridium butyricum 60E.3]